MWQGERATQESCLYTIHSPHQTEFLTIPKENNGASMCILEQAKAFLNVGILEIIILLCWGGEIMG